MENLQEKIAKRAFDLFMARGGQDGYHIQDWLQAEKEMLTVSSAPVAAKKVVKVAADAKTIPAVAPKKKAVAKK